MATVRECLETKITDACDVLVCGGGVAGISAALAAARCGSRVILLERQFLLGGLGTAGLVTIYLPLDDGLGRQVASGIAEELLRLSISLGAEDRYPANWLEPGTEVKRTARDPRFEVQYNPQLFAILAERLLLENGVKILYGSYAVGVDKADDRIAAVLVENKSGRQAIRVRSVVDATGDCDIAHFAGAPTVEYSEGNTLASWYYSLGKNGYRLNMTGFSDIPDNASLEVDENVQAVDSSTVGTPTTGGDGKNLASTSAFTDNRKYAGMDGEELSEMVQAAHSSILGNLLRRRAMDETLIPTAIAQIPQVRMTRRLVGEYTLHDTEVHRCFADSVGLLPDWRKRGPVYEVPFSCLYSRKVRNLITAGRCISVTDAMWDISRVIPCCAVTGQAAGTAAAMTGDFTQLNLEKYQSVLRQNGVLLHESECKSTCQESE